MAARVNALNASGGESPDMEEIQTRFSTPVSDLDDHRNLSPARPRGDTLSASNAPKSPRSPEERDGISEHASRHTFSPDLARPKQHGGQREPMSQQSEHAILDDDASIIDGHIIERRGSRTLGMPRRGTVRRSRNRNTSRDSSPSSRASSPANSVDAFADPRRRERANTFESHTVSELNLGLQRTISGGTHTRRPTFNNGSVRALSFQNERDPDQAAEKDVCFSVVDEPPKTWKIDFDELDEFVANYHTQDAEKVYHCQKRLSFSSQGKLPNVSGDLRTQNLPTITTCPASELNEGSELAEKESDSVLNEKLDANKDANYDGHEPAKRRNSFSDNIRYSFFSTEIEQTIHASDFGDLLGPGETFRDLLSLPEDVGVWWLDIQNPTKDEMEALQKGFGIHRLTTEDIITQEAREKVELFKQYYFVCFRSFYQVDEKHEDYMEPVNVYLVVFPEGIISITYEKSPHAANVRKRIGRLRDFMALSADWICYAMIDNIVDTFGPPIHSIEVEADTIEDQVFVAREGDFAPLLRQIGQCRKKVMSLMRLLGGKADVIKGFSKRCNERFGITPHGEIGLYLSDIQDHVVTMMSNLGHFEKMLSRSHSNYLAQLSVDHIAQGNRANEVLSKITVMASILVPLNLICGLFGMNVNVPGKSDEGLAWFFGILGVIFLFVIFCLGVAKKLRYI